MKGLKKYLTTVLLISSMMSCVTLSKSLQRKLSERRLRPCKENDTEQNVGKFCYRWCHKKKFLSKKCKEWRVETYDFLDPAFHKKMIYMNFVLIKEERIN